MLEESGSRGHLEDGVVFDSDNNIDEPIKGQDCFDVQNEIANIHDGGPRGKFNKFLNLDNLDKETFLQLFEKVLKMQRRSMQVNELFKIAKKFDLLDKDIVNRFIDYGIDTGSQVVANLEAVKGLDVELIVTLINNTSNSEEMFDKLKVMEGFADMVPELIRTGGAEFIVEHLDEIEEIVSINHQAIALQIIEDGKGSVVLNNIKKFKGIDYTVANALIDQNVFAKYSDGEMDMYNILISNIQIFSGLDHKKFVLKLIESGQSARYSVARDIHFFEGLDNNDILIKLFESDVNLDALNYFIDYKGFGIEKKEDLIQILKNYPDSNISRAINNLNIEDSTGFESLILEESEYFEWLHKKGLNFLDKEDISNIKEFNLSLLEGHSIKEGGLDIANLDSKTEDNFKMIYEKLCEQFSKDEDINELWDDRENIAGPFERGSEHFGYLKMFEYISRPGLSRHDALHNFDKILECLKTSDLDPHVFYNQILSQVIKDSARYEGGTAHHEMNSVSSNIRHDVESVFLEARKYSEINKLQKLIDEMGSVRGCPITPILTIFLKFFC
ncbi:hypothetical protein KJ785_03865 [Patescibacteria group bacterium]|nr:hypothetical protein [Patescibacteria group bacterium]